MDLAEDKAEIDELNADVESLLDTDVGFGSDEELNLFVAEAAFNNSLFSDDPYLQSCDLLCHKDCMKIKKPAPFPILEICTK